VCTLKSVGKLSGTVAVRLIGRHDGRVFLDRNTQFALGEGSEINIVDGVEQGLRSMKSGERAVLRINAKHAYGAEGCERLGVPPDAYVEFDVDLESYDPVFVSSHPVYCASCIHYRQCKASVWCLSVCSCFCLSVPSGV